MTIDVTIPFWAIVILVFVIGCLVCYIISLFAEEGGYIGDIFNALLVVAVFFVTIFLCIGMLVGKYLF